MQIKIHTITKRFVELVELEENEEIKDRLKALRKDGFDIIHIWQPRFPEELNFWEIIYRKFLRLPKGLQKEED